MIQKIIQGTLTSLDNKQGNLFALGGYNPYFEPYKIRYKYVGIPYVKYVATNPPYEFHILPDQNYDNFAFDDRGGISHTQWYPYLNIQELNFIAFTKSKINNPPIGFNSYKDHNFFDFCSLKELKHTGIMNFFLSVRLTHKSNFSVPDIIFTTSLLGFTSPLEYKTYTFDEANAISTEEIFSIQYKFVEDGEIIRYWDYDTHDWAFKYSAKEEYVLNFPGHFITPDKEYYGFRMKTDPIYDDSEDLKWAIEHSNCYIYPGQSKMI